MPLFCRAAVVAALFLAVLHAASFAAQPGIPKTGADAKAFVPAGWDMMKEARGDLNKDGIPDAAFVLKNKIEDKDRDPGEVPRLLVIIFGTSAGGYTLSATSDKAILCKEGGGVFGDPFAQIRIVRGAIVIDHYGGSRERWGYTHRWCYQDDDWFLIGLTALTQDTGTGTSEATDTNLVTGDRTVKKTGPSGKSTTTRTKVPARPLQRLSAFTFEY